MTQEFTEQLAKWEMHLHQLGYRKVVTCKDCKHRIEHKHYGDMGESAYTCEGNMDGWILPDDFCSKAERRTDD